MSSWPEEAALEVENTPKPPTSGERIIKEAVALQPKIITNFTPDNRFEQRDALIAGDITSPRHTYTKLEAVNYNDAYQKLGQLETQVIEDSSIPNKYTSGYLDLIRGYEKKTRFMQVAHLYHQEGDSVKKDALRSEYMSLNSELYGEPDRDTYAGLMGSRLAKIESYDLDEKMSSIRDELFSTMPSGIERKMTEVYQPNPETVAWVAEAARALYGGLIEHIPDQESFSALEAAEVFTTMLRKEFGDAAAEWRVDVEKAVAINVKTDEKRIVIGEQQKLSRSRMIELTAHEIGVHTLRSVMGGETDAPFMANGLDDYYDAEEGLGMVMEQAIGGGYRQAGVDHYLSIGSAFFEDFTFTDVFNMKWRMDVLSQAGNGAEMNEERILKAKRAAYTKTLRTFRGTDELPWFKDLSYYNGTKKMWQHMESIHGDDHQLTAAFLGKIDPANSIHERLAYETSTP